MKKTFYRVEYVLFHEYDEADEENIEKRFLIGFFSTSRMAKKSIQECLKYDGILEKNFEIKKYRVIAENNLNVLFMPFHEYSIKNTSEEYIDYYYTFSPKSTIKDAENLIKFYKARKKYKTYENRDYSTYSPDGFGIDEITINKIYFNGL